jgi:DNA polymerase-4
VLSREQACERFAGSPPGLLPGIGPKTAARLAALGLPTLAALRAAPEQELIARFGPHHGRDLARRARFEHDGEVGARSRTMSESRERTFDTDVSDPEQLREMLAAMARQLCASLVAHGRRGRTIGIKVRLDDFQTVTRAHTLAEATCDVEVVTTEAMRLLAEYAPPRPVRLLGVRVAGLTSGDAPAAGPVATREGEQALGEAAPADQLALPV